MHNDSTKSVRKPAHIVHPSRHNLGVRIHADGHIATRPFVHRYLQCEQPSTTSDNPRMSAKWELGEHAVGLFLPCDTCQSAPRGPWRCQYSEATCTDALHRWPWPSEQPTHVHTLCVQATPDTQANSVAEHAGICSHVNAALAVLQVHRVPADLRFLRLLVELRPERTCPHIHSSELPPIDNNNTLCVCDGAVTMSQHNTNGLLRSTHLQQRERVLAVDDGRIDGVHGHQPDVAIVKCTSTNQVCV